MPTATHARLPADLRSLCGRLATERTRAAGWTLAAEIRKSTLARLQAGESAVDLAAALERDILEALRLQRRLP